LKIQLKALFDYSNWFGLWFDQTVHSFMTVLLNRNQTLQTTSGDGLLGLSKMAVPPLPIVILPD
jgi:hypothetical protein